MDVCACVDHLGSWRSTLCKPLNILGIIAYVIVAITLHQKNRGGLDELRLQHEQSAQAEWLQPKFPNKLHKLRK